MKSPSRFALVALLTSLLVGLFSVQYGLVAYFAFQAYALHKWPAFSNKHGTATLTTSQVLLDVLQSFRKWFPGLSLIGTEFRGSPLKLNQTYIAHIASLPSASSYDASTGYLNGANSARGLLADIPVLVSGHPTVPLEWLHLDQIKDIKNNYDEVIGNAAYVLAKSAVDSGVFAKCTSRYFTRERTIAEASFDYDALMAIASDMNSVGCLPVGRVLFVNSNVAAELATDARLTSKDYAGQLLDGNGYRQWRNVGGFALIQEYPDLPLNNATALTGVTGANSGDVMTKSSHGLVTGDPVTFISGTTFTGLTAGTRYFAIRVDADTFKVATTRANALAGTAVELSADGTAGVFQLQENLIAFACDKRAIAYLSGIPEGMRADICEQLGIPRVMNFDVVTDPVSGMSMAAAKWQAPGTGKAYFVPTFVYGTHAGKQGDATTSVLAAAKADGSGCDYAGLRITKGPST